LAIKPHNLDIQTELIPKREFGSQSQRRNSPRTSHHGISPDDRECGCGWQWL